MPLDPNPYEPPQQHDGSAAPTRLTAARFNFRPVLIALSACNLGYSLFATLGAFAIVKSMQGLGWLFFYLWLSWTFFCFALNLSFRLAMIVFVTFFIALYLISSRL